jgi:hypothetical protein
MQDWRLAVDGSNNVYCGSLTSFLRLTSTLGATATWTLSLIVRGIAFSGSSIYVTGTATSGSGQWHMYVSKLVASTGATTWTSAAANQSRPLAYPGNDIFTPSNSTTYGGNAVRVDGQGNVYVASTSVTGSFAGGTLTKHSQFTGTVTWSKQIGYDDLDSTCFDVTTDASNNVYVSCTDHQQHTFSSSAIAVIYNSSGVEQLWLSNDGPGGLDDGFERVLLAPSGGLYLLDESGTWNFAGTDEVFVPWIWKYTITGL